MKTKSRQFCVLVRHNRYHSVVAHVSLVIAEGERGVWKLNRVTPDMGALPDVQGLVEEQSFYCRADVVRAVLSRMCEVKQLNW